MKILFSVSHFGFLRNFEPALRQLAERGHGIHLVADRKEQIGGMRTVENLVAAYPERITYGWAPGRRDSAWYALAVQLRLCLDYWRYLEPRYDHSPKLRARGASQAPRFASLVTSRPLLRSRLWLAALTRVFRTLEAATPTGPIVDRFLREQDPDLLVVTPLLYFGSTQVDYVRAARARGIPTMLCVGSWDHLTTKGLVHAVPDRVTVWNESQRQEARELHDIEPERVTVTGAQAYDHWFVGKPSVPRETFCRRVGLPSDRPLLLYLCSSPFIAPHEVGFVRKWIEAIRRAPDPRLRDAALLVRPHPQNAEQWQEVDFSAYGAVAIWPRGGANPVDTDARAEYFDSMYYSVAVVGVNTSALIESAIVGRPVYTVTDGDFEGTQEGTLHFRHLRSVNGGLLHVAPTLGDHVAQLSGALDHEGPVDDKGRRFLEAFVRPGGLDRPAAPILVAAIESAGALKVRPERPPFWQAIVRALLYPAALAARWSSRRRKSARSLAASTAAPRPPAGRGLKILFAMASPEYLRYYDSTIRLLAERGHHVVIGANKIRDGKPVRLETLGDGARVEIAGLIPKRNDVWMPFARALRGTMDFVRYFHPSLAHAVVLRARIKRRVLPRLLHPLDRISALGEGSYRRAMDGLKAIEQAIPVSPRIARFLDAHDPDLVVVSPLVDAASDQVDLVKAVRARGGRTAACIASWDNLTNKGDLRIATDMVVVWNEIQKREAVDYHRVNPDRVVVTGAQLFDRWFDRGPSRNREAFCGVVGLPAGKPYVLFVGSSMFISQADLEIAFVRRWIQALRGSSDPAVRALAVLVRPHPYNGAAWATADLSEFKDVAVWPKGRHNPVDEANRSDFFDSMHHSEAVVGINTSAMIEAAIVGRPVLSIATAEFAGTQDGTLHFHYLLPENGGFLRIASNLDEHTRQLGSVLQEPDLARAELSRFVASFIRPLGIDKPCTPIVADTLERLGRSPAAEPVVDPLGARVLRVLLYPTAVLTSLFPDGKFRGDRLKGWVRGTPFQPDRALKGIRKQLVTRPARRVRRVIVGGSRAVRGSLQFVRSAGISLTRKAFRGARHLRYRAALLFRSLQ